MFLECILNEKQAYNDSVGSRLESEPQKPFDFVPRSIFKTVILTKKIIDVHLDTTKAFKYIGLARARDYDLVNLFKCEFLKVYSSLQKTMSCANLITKVSWKEQLKKNWSNHPSE